jgi:RNA ligase
VIELQIQKFKRSGGTDEDLFAKYAINARRHPQYPNLAMYKYDQIGSPFHERIVQECRGIILDAGANYRVVNLAMYKFFNLHEPLAAEIDWSTASVQEKCDGSLIQAYRYDGNWHIASSGTPDAGGEVNGFGVSFRDYFLQTFAKYDQEWPDAYENLCFFFELTGPLNRIVVNHKESGVVLLGGRNLADDELRELPLQEASLYFPKIPTVKTCPMTSVAEMVAAFETMNPLEQEGFVVRDAQDRRIKVKCPAYVTLHSLKGGMSRRAIVEIVRKGETSEIESAFPEFAEMLEECRGRYGKLVSECERDMHDLRGIAVQKEFALQAVHKRCPGALFAVRAGKYIDFKHYFAEGLHLDNLISTLGYKPNEQMPGQPENLQGAA